MDNFGVEVAMSYSEQYSTREQYSTSVRVGTAGMTGHPITLSGSKLYIGILA